MLHRLRRSLLARLNLLALKIAAYTAIPLGAVYAVGEYASTGRFSLAGYLLVLLISFLFVYGISLLLIGRRLRLAYRTLLRIRRHDFADLPAARVPPGDELSGLIRQVYRTGRAMQREIEEFRKLENYRREYLGNVSHELKTPIFAIQGFAETLLDGAIHDKSVNREFLKRIITHAERLTALANDLTEISRIESRELKMTPAPFDLRVLVEEVLESLEVEAGQLDIALKCSLPEDLAPVVADRDRIRQVLVNLVENGIRYNNPGGFVEVRAMALPSGHVKISVVDNGIGIQRGHVSRLTERFYRVDQSRSRSKGGTGLGLAIVKHILEAHDQRLTVESLPSEGSTFSFVLPGHGAERPKPKPGIEPTV